MSSLTASNGYAQLGAVGVINMDRKHGELTPQVPIITTIYHIIYNISYIIYHISYIIFM